MVWAILVVATAVLGAGAMVAAGAWRGMAATPLRDDFIPTLPATPLTGDDLSKVRFQVQLRGYDMASVDELLARLGREIDQREAELEVLRGLASSSRSPGNSHGTSPDAE